MSWQGTSILFADLQDKEIRPVSIEGQKIVLIREGEAVYALEDRCSHDNSVFEGGQIIDGNLECPRHGAWFDYKTGEATGMPAVLGVKTYSTDIRDGIVYVEVK